MHGEGICRADLQREGIDVAALFLHVPKQVLLMRNGHGCSAEVEAVHRSP